jgi:hypothetical protein
LFGKHKKCIIMGDFSWVFSTVGLAVSLVFVLWGLKIFKAFIVVTGVAIGAVIGSLIGLRYEPQWLFILLGAGIGGYVAIPLQKFFVFMGFGLFSGIIGIIIGAAININPLAFGAVFFLAGGILAVVYFDHFVILLMAFNASLHIFQYIWLRRIYGSGSFFDFLQDGNFSWLVGGLSTNLLVLAIILLGYSWFALYFQKKLPFIAKTSIDGQRWFFVFQRVTFFFFGFFMVSRILIELRLGWHFLFESFYFITGSPSELLLPLQVWVFSWIAYKYSGGLGAIRRDQAFYLNALKYVVLTGALSYAMATAFIIIFRSADYSYSVNIWSAIVNLPPFRIFVYHFLGFPLLLYLLVVRPFLKKSFAEPLPTQEAHNLQTPLVQPVVSGKE